MNKALKKAIVCSLMVSFMQGGLVTPLIVAAQENNPQQNQEQQQETEFQKQKRQEQQRQQQQRRQARLAMALELPSQEQQHQGHQHSAEAVSHVNRGTRLAVELTAEVIGADVLSQVKAVGKIHRRPPLAMAGGQVDAGHRRIVAANPAAKGNLADHQQQAQRRQATQANT